ncbi:MAG TPA: hypothetical protein VGA37_12785 [Gemmatimonadales bacterium]
MKTRALGSLVLLLGLVATGQATAQAQGGGLREVHRHQGFWFSIGAGGGWADTDFRLGNTGRGGAGYFRMGGTVSPRVLFGGEVLAWFTRVNGRDISRANITAAALLYPSLRGGWFIKPGFGFATYDIDGFERSGIATTVGTGFDFRLTRNFYVTPNVDYQVQFFADDTVGSLLISLGATWH